MTINTMISVIRQAFTLVELMIVMAIIAVLSALILTAVIGTQRSVDYMQTTTLVESLGFSMKIYQLDSRGYPFPDDSTNPADPDQKRIGFLRYDRTLNTPGIINHLVNVQGYAFDSNNLLDENNHLTDAWGNAIIYVLGNYKNRIGNTGYDNTKPQDLNKPKDGDIPAADSNWNTKDSGKFPYIYSTGEITEEGDSAWIY